MNSTELSVVEAFILAINRHDIPGLSRLMAAEHSFIDSSGSILSGRENMAAGWKEYFRMFPDYQIHVERILADRALVAVFGSASGTYDGKRGAIAENRIAMPAAWKALVENGEILVWQVYADWTEGRKTIEKDNESG
jgi:limonene-1,2-epoxide hydrolase